eukprot:bmy_16552T0
MQLRTPGGQILTYCILQTFPFTSESKRMGVIVRDESTAEITFYMKGADVAMSTVVQYNDWLEEECGNMAREGLRTLVVAKRALTEEQYQDFENRYNQAKLSIHDRTLKVAAVVESLEREMELLCLTGVEDQLQADVRPTLEMLRNAGIKVCLKYYEHEFVELACQCPAVVCCRCAPTQKAHIVKLLQQHTGRRTCAIGDGGNDVSMIQAADCGIGIEGKEGRQASLAADFSVPQFKHIGRLLVVHGRSSYKRSAALSQFVMHRGLIISTMQAVFSSVFYFASVPLYQGFLMVGYATVYTMFPVFSLVLDQDVKPEMAMLYPELYKDLTKNHGGGPALRSLGESVHECLGRGLETRQGSRRGTRHRRAPARGRVGGGVSGAGADRGRKEDLCARVPGSVPGRGCGRRVGGIQPLGVLVLTRPSVLCTGRSLSCKTFLVWVLISIYQVYLVNRYPSSWSRRPLHNAAGVGVFSGAGHLKTDLFLNKRQSRKI